MRLVFSNNPETLLLTAVAAGDTALVLQSGAAFPALGAGETFPVTVQDIGGMEIMLCTARAGDTLTVTRAQEGTTALAFGAGAVVQARITAKALLAFMQRDADETMLGMLTLAADPVDPLHAATKQYVDSEVGGVAGSTYTKTEADDRFINVDGDAMVGDLTLANDPTDAMHAVTKNYVDDINTVLSGDIGFLSDEVAARVLRGGDTMGGMLTLFAEPTADMHAATKAYVDAHSGGGGGSSVTISDTPPPSPAIGDLWFDSTTLLLFLRYDDGTSIQWVQTIPVYDPFTQDEADLRYIKRSGDVMMGVLGLLPGTAAAPGLTFPGDTDTGLYRPAADTVGLAAGGVGRLLVSTQVQIPNAGTGAVPSLAIGPSNNGLNWTSGTSVEMISNGASRGSWSSGAFSLSVPLAVAVTASLTNTITTVNGTGLDIQVSGAGKGLIVTCPGASAGDPFTVEDSTRPDATPFVVKNDGLVGIGSTTPRCILDIVNTGAITLPSGTDAQRPATPNTAMFRHNTTANAIEWHNGTTWTALAAGTITNDVPRLDTRKESAVVDNLTTTAAPVLTGMVTPANAGSDYFQIQPRRYLTPDATNAYSDGPAISLIGPTRPTNPNELHLFAGNNTIGYKQWRFTDGGVLVVPGVIYLPNDNAVQWAGVSSVYRSAAGHFFIVPRGDYYMYWNNADGAWRWQSGSGSSTEMVLDPAGNLTIRGFLSGPLGGGGVYVRGPSGHNCTIGWENLTGTWMPYINEQGGTTKRMASAVNAWDFGYAGGTGGPTSVSLNGRENGGTLYGIYCDAVSDARIKNSIHDTEVDALAVLRALPVRAYNVNGDVAAWQRSVGRTTEERAAMMTSAQDVPVAIGFVTQEVLAAGITEAVNVPKPMPQPEGSPLPEDTQTLIHQLLVPYLWRQNQQQQDRIEALEARLAVLEESNAV